MLIQGLSKTRHICIALFVCGWCTLHGGNFDAHNFFIETVSRINKCEDKQMDNIAQEQISNCSTVCHFENALHKKRMFDNVNIILVQTSGSHQTDGD